LNDFWVNGDLLLFRQILNNLIGNACKFTKKGSVTLELRLQLLSDSTVKVCIDVIDTGIGIADEEQQLIFQKFKQASNNKEKHYSGTGLGLVITKKLVELQNGTIQLKSRLNEGSTFSIHIPFERCEKIAEIEEQEIDVSSIGESKILIVEDNYLNQRYITTLMNKWSIDYELAKDGLVAVDLCKKEKFDLVLMDVNMPKLDGFEASRKILGSCKYNKSTPIVALTASGLKHTKVETERVGMVDFLLKPLHPEDLKKILVKYCPKRAVPKSDMERFIFDSSLDSSYLDSIFDGDVDYAKEMFEIFFESTAIEFKEIGPYFANNDYGAAKSLVHKLKPSFHMVGLTKIGGLMDELERQLQDPDNNESSRLLFNKIQEMYASAESVLKRDLERMQDFLTK
jgi:CheY-like chemotaxis protein